jgi:hypothetical protein
MPLSQYLLLALLAAGGVASADGGPTTAATLGANAIVQPNGGALSSVYPPQETPKKEDSHVRRLSKTRHGRKGKVTHRRVRTPETPKKDGGSAR